MPNVRYDPHTTATPSQRRAAVERELRRSRFERAVRPPTNPLAAPIEKVLDPPADRWAWFRIEEEIDPLQPRSPKIQEIQAATARHYGISRMDLISERRTANVVGPRHVAMYLSHALTLRSFPAIGRMTGNRDHTTVIHGVRKIEHLKETDAALAADIEAIKAIIADKTSQ